MKDQWILTVYIWNVGMVILRVQAVCEDTQDCKNINCKSPGVANFCKKTCKICTAEGCKAGFYEAENGQCISCEKSQLITDSYNRSCPPCPKGLWGLDCNTSCGVGCINNTCNKWTGKCKEGCISCFKGDKCDHTRDSCDCKGIKCKCKNGFYANNCLQKCQPGCKTEQKACDQMTGKCSNGCARGYSGDKCDRNCSLNCVGGTCDQSEGNCDKGCVLGWFGTQCTLICPSNCNNNNCSRQDGNCYEGCSPGWFGDHCNLTCPINCNNTTCVQKDGWCNKGCKKGWHGGKCNKGCSKNCISDTCNRTDGSCQGCNEGYKGYQCNMTCPRHCVQCDQYGDNCFVCKHGWYGLTCEKSCNSCTEGKCNITDGSCLLGCKDGFYGRFCNSKCINCKDNSDGPLCSRESGSCTGNCTDGWYGNRCDQKCLLCKYHRCDRITGNCPMNVVEGKQGCNSCTEGKCNITDGSCLLGCKDGFYGRFCNSKCSINCKDNSDGPLCSRESGNCTGNCTDGWYGKRCDRKCSLQCKYKRCVRITGHCILTVGEGKVSVWLTSPVNTFVWAMATAVCFLTFLVMVLLIQRFRRRFSSCCSISPRGIYISAVHVENEEGLEQQCGLPLSPPLHLDNSGHEYATIADSDVVSVDSTTFDFPERKHESVL